MRLDHRGRVLSRTGCDTTFTPNTLCLDAIMVQHPYLEGADGIVLDDDENIFVAANERNSIAVVTDEGRAVEYFRNPAPAATRLRNAGPLEFPTSPVLVGRKLCMTNSDGNRRDNSPPTPGEGAEGQLRRLTDYAGTGEAGVAAFPSASPVSASKPCRRAGSTAELDRVADGDRRPRLGHDRERGAVVLGQQDVVVGGGVDRVRERARAQPRRVDADDHVGLGAEPLDDLHAARRCRGRRA